MRATMGWRTPQPRWPIGKDRFRRDNKDGYVFDGDTLQTHRTKRRYVGPDATFEEVAALKAYFAWFGDFLTSPDA